MWPWGLTFIILMLSILNTLFMHVPFILNLIWWIVASALYYGLSYYTIAKDIRKGVEEATIIPLINGGNAVRHSFLLHHSSLLKLY